MNFSAAIRAHANWRLRLSTCCQANAKETIDIQTLAKNDACDLGKWLCGEGRRYASDPRFGELINTHAAFHRHSAEIAAMARNGKRKEAEALINSNESPFAKTSVQVVGILMKFRTQYGD